MNSRFGAYDVPGTLGGLGQGFSQPNLMFFGFARTDLNGALKPSLQELRESNPWKNYITSEYFRFKLYPDEQEYTDIENVPFLSNCEILDLVEETVYNNLTDDFLKEIFRIYDYSVPSD